MQTQVATRSTDYAQAIAELVAGMSVQRAAQVYDFACFLQTRPERDDDDWLNDSEQQMQAEDALWDEANARHSDKFAALAQAAREEIAAGATQPMFDEHKEFVDELAHDSELSEGV
jgi:flagellum-specific peptidoglycan hydrolase FlgJ